jgi:cell shape-determining protein MreC
MKKIINRTSFFYIIVICVLLVILSLPLLFTQKIRTSITSFLSPLWTATEKINGSKEDQEEDSLFALENRVLHDQIDSVYEWLNFEERIQEQIEQMKTISAEKHDDLYWNEFFRRRSDELRQVLEIQMQAIPARIIFRDPTSWSSNVWINVGEKDNEMLGKLVIAKNSPVVIGSSLVGVVERVEQNISQIRLITDPNLIPAVRAVRGAQQNHIIAEAAKNLYELIATKDVLFENGEQKKVFLETLANILSKLNTKGKSFYLAKGELHGCSQPLWRTCGRKLKGIGFNYEYADEEGPKRDLRTGIAQKNSISPLPILQKEDLLITTGMDGIFPAGLDVAIVTEVSKLKRGDFVYEIEARPTAYNIDELKVVFVMPPLEFTKKD